MRHRLVSMLLTAAIVASTVGAGTSVTVQAAEAEIAAEAVTEVESVAAPQDLDVAAETVDAAVSADAAATTDENTVVAEPTTEDETKTASADDAQDETVAEDGAQTETTDDPQVETVQEDVTAVNAEIPDATNDTVIGDEVTVTEDDTELIMEEAVYDSEFDNDAAFGDYVDQVFSTEESDTTEDHGIYRRTYLDTLQRKIYDDIKAKAKQVANGELSSTEFKTYIKKSEYQTLKAMSTSEWSAYAKQIINALVADCPYEFYWWGRSWSCGYTSSYVSSNWSVALDYSYSGGTGTCTVDTAKTSAASKAQANAQAIANSCKNFDYYPDIRSVITEFKNQICALASYDYDAASKGVSSVGNDPWSIIHVFDGDPNTKVVCEGYAKAFKYLCDLINMKLRFDCDVYLVSGLSTNIRSGNSGGHMWNVVQTWNDYKNYVVDLTNCDYNDKVTDTYFLKVPSSRTTITYNGETRTNSYTFGNLRYTYYDETLDQFKESEIGNITTQGWDVDAQNNVRTGNRNEFYDEKNGTGSFYVEPYTGWKTENGKDYWYENDVKQGTTGRGKEIYDPDSDAWYWLDAVQGGAKAVSKDVYQPYTINGKDNIGKWVRYDANGHMLKGWSYQGVNGYYFDLTTGAMCKGWMTINGNTYYFDTNTGIMVKDKVTIDGIPCWFDAVGVGKDKVWDYVNGVFYWYENGQRQGYNPKDSSYRGKEIYDPRQRAWFWLDNNAQGSKAVSKDVYQPYTYYGKDNIGKWVRYDANGRMIKGWQTTSKGQYYFDPTTGAMTKGWRTISGKRYYFDPQTGVLVR